MNWLRALLLVGLGGLGAGSGCATTGSLPHERPDCPSLTWSRCADSTHCRTVRHAVVRGADHWETWTCEVRVDLEYLDAGRDYGAPTASSAETAPPPAAPRP